MCLYNYDWALWLTRLREYQRCLKVQPKAAASKRVEVGTILGTSSLSSSVSSGTLLCCFIHCRSIEVTKACPFVTASPCSRCCWHQPGIYVNNSATLPPKYWWRETDFKILICNSTDGWYSINVIMLTSSLVCVFIALGPQLYYKLYLTKFFESPLHQAYLTDPNLWEKSHKFVLLLPHTSVFATLL